MQAAAVQAAGAEAAVVAATEVAVGGGGYGAAYRAPTPPAPEVGHSEGSEDQALPKAKKTVGDSENPDKQARPKAKTNSPLDQ